MKQAFIWVIAIFVLLFLLIFSIRVSSRLQKPSVFQPTPAPEPSHSSQEADLFNASSASSMPPSAQRNGVIYRQTVGASTYYLVSAFLPTLPKGSLYQGWLVNTDNKALLLGTFYPEQKQQNRWTLVVNNKDTYEGYRKIWITREQKDDGKPEQLVLQGAFY